MFRQADRLRPGHPEVQTGLGYCAMDEGRTGAAIGHFRRALASSGSYGPALLGMADASRGQGASRQALEYYRRYVSAHPAGPGARRARMQVDRLEEEVGESAPPAPTPAPTPGAGSDAGAGTPESPSVTRVTEDLTPPTPRSDSLAIDSEPPLRPGEVID